MALLLTGWLAQIAIASSTGSAPAFESSAPEWVSIRLFPERRILRGKSASQQFLLMGTLPDGGQKDVADEAVFSLADPTVARLEGRGRVVTVADGETEVTAVLGELEARAFLRVEDSTRKRPFYFARDIGSILTRRGCNQRSCHAGVKGQGGFKLSVNAAHPQKDYQWIVGGGTYQVLTDEPGEPRVPRINREEPARSLLLQKPTMETPHGGGVRIETESHDYQTILIWIQKGVPYREEGENNGIKVVRFEVFPQEVVLQRGGRQQLVVSAYLADGSVEDFTHQVRFESNHPEVADLSSQGLVTALNAGETTILVRGAGHEVRSSIGVVAEVLPDDPNVPRHNFIDEQIFSKLQKFSIVPSELSGDAEFLRRICLDLTGRLPPVARVLEFLADQDPEKREKLIGALLESPEFVDYWTFRFADLFRVAVFPVGINPKWTQAYWEWIRDAVARNRPYNQLARERLEAQGYNAPSRHYLPHLVVPPPENIMGEEVRVFLGRRLDCAQCHDHPYESWTQDQFWGMTAFFGSMFKLGGNEESVVFDHPGGKEVAADVPSPTERRVLHPRTEGSGRSRGRY